MIRILQLIGLTGAIVFGALLALTFSAPETVEQSAKGFIKLQIDKEVRERYLASKESGIADKAKALAGKLGYDEQRLQQWLDEELPKKIAQVLAAACGYDCEKKKAIAQNIATSWKEKISNLKVAQQRLGDVVRGKYVEIVGKLRSDVRIFLGSNTAVFLVLLLVSFVKPTASRHLLLPAGLLLLATVVMTSFYLFGQNWFYTIIYNDYMGFSYLGYLGVVFLFLMDIVFNSARVTVEIVNAILQAIGSALSLGPC